MYMTIVMTQYVKNKSKYFRDLGRWLSIVYWTSPEYKCRTVSAYNICKSMSGGFRTQYKQIKRYCHKNGKGNSREFFEKDVVKQCQEREKDKRLFMVMDRNIKYTRRKFDLHASSQKNRDERVFP